MTKSKPVRKTARSKSKPKSKAAPVAPPLVRLVVAALDAKKAEDLQVLDVGAISSITDYMVVATGTSEPHLRALRVELEKVIDAQKAPILGMDTGRASGWIVVDAFDVMVHLFTRENRTRFMIETLWKDAGHVAIADLLERRDPSQ